MELLWKAARDWWEDKRPEHWTLEDHLKNATINCDVSEWRLANAVANEVRKRGG